VESDTRAISLRVVICELDNQTGPWSDVSETRQPPGKLSTLALHNRKWSDKKNARQVARFLSRSTRQVSERIGVDCWVRPVHNQRTKWTMRCLNVLHSVGPYDYTLKPLKPGLPNKPSRITCFMPGVDSELIRSGTYSTNAILQLLFQIEHSTNL
jgi:hypothetical protein